MNDSLAEDYLRWLGLHIRDEQDTHGYWDLLRTMFKKEFVWLVPNDDNRLVDGLDLRVEFCYSQNIRASALKNLGPCSFLEVLVGLSHRLSFAAGGLPQGWGWQLVENLGLNKMPDPLTQSKVRKIDDILDTVIWRTYNSNGCGGFFPLAWPNEDQTKKELWYQMAAYIEELHPEHYR